MENATQPLLCPEHNFNDQSHVGNGLIHHREAASTSSLPGSDEGEIGIIRGISDLYKEFLNEWKKLMYLAAPSIFTSLCQYAIWALTIVFAGHLGTTQLAAVSVENSVVAGFGFGILLGMGSGLETLCGQAYGANKHHMLGIYLQRSWIVLNAVALAMVFLFIFATPILKFLGQATNISDEVGKFSLWMIPQQFAYAMMIPLTKFLQAQSKVLEMALIAVVAMCLNAILGWIFMVKMNLGLLGAALMLNISWWFMTGAQFLYVMAGNCGPTWSGFSWKAFSNIPGFVKLSISSAVMLSLELWYLMALTFVTGHLENAEVSLDALSICVNIIGWSGTVGLGFNVAISVRVSNELGCGHYRRAKFSAMVAWVTSCIFGLGFALILVVFRKQYPALFTTSSEVEMLVEDLTPLLGISVIFTCVQYALSGVVIGAGWQNFVGYINAGGYFLIGVPIAILMCYKLNMGFKGIWCGMVIGLCLQTCLIFWLVCTANWKKEADVAVERLNEWSGEMNGSPI